MRVYRRPIFVDHCGPNTSLAREAIDILPEFGIPMARSRFHQRPAYRQSAVYGGTVHNLGNKAAPAIIEVDTLADEVLEILQEAISLVKK